MCLHSYGEESNRKRVGELKDVSGKAEEGMTMQWLICLLRLIFQAKYKENSLKCFTHWGYYMISLPFWKGHCSCSMDNRLECLEMNSRGKKS